MVRNIKRARLRTFFSYTLSVFARAWIVSGPCRSARNRGRREKESVYEIGQTEKRAKKKRQKLGKNTRDKVLEQHQ